MKAILLAAGRGTRISRMIEEVPKSTLPIDGVPLIRHTVEMLEKAGIKSVVCVGYEQQRVREALEGLDVEYCHNPFYDVTNSIASLWFAQKHLDDEMLIMNADVYFSKDILNLILEDKRDVVMAIDKTRIEVGDYFFKTTANGCIMQYGKELPLVDRSCEYVGVAKIGCGFLKEFIDRMNKLVESQRHSLWWENILYSFTKERDIYTIDVDGRFWSEIDYFDDYERILAHIREKNIRKS